MVEGGREGERERETVVVARFFAHSLTLRSDWWQVDGGDGCAVVRWVVVCRNRTVDAHALDRSLARPLARLHTGIRPTHASYGYLKESLVGLPPQKDKKKWVQGGMVKGRNEPGCLGQVVEVVSGVMGVPVEAVKHASTKNAQDMFFS